MSKTQNVSTFHELKMSVFQPQIFNIILFSKFILYYLVNLYYFFFIIFNIMLCYNNASFNFRFWTTRGRQHRYI